MTLRLIGLGIRRRPPVEAHLGSAGKFAERLVFAVAPVAPAAAPTAPPPPPFAFAIAVAVRFAVRGARFGTLKSHAFGRWIMGLGRAVAKCRGHVRVVVVGLVL